jgi:hypothetical protein
LRPREGTLKVAAARRLVRQFLGDLLQKFIAGEYRNAFSRRH